MSIVDICQQNVKDYLPTANINQGTMYPILPEQCKCGKRIACYQRYIESFLGNELEKLENIENLNEKQSKSRIALFEKTGIIKDCCIMSLTMYPFLTINDIEGHDAYVDTTVSLVVK